MSQFKLSYSVDLASKQINGITQNDSTSNINTLNSSNTSGATLNPLLSGAGVLNTAVTISNATNTQVSSTLMQPYVVKVNDKVSFDATYWSYAINTLGLFDQVWYFVDYSGNTNVITNNAHWTNGQYYLNGDVKQIKVLKSKLPESGAYTLNVIAKKKRVSSTQQLYNTYKKTYNFTV